MEARNGGHSGVAGEVLVGALARKVYAERRTVPRSGPGASSSVGERANMRAITLGVGATLMLWTFAWLAPARLLAQEETTPGELLDPAGYGPGVIESLDAAIERDRHAPPPKNDKARQPGEHGVWMVPSRGATTFPHSGLHNAVNKWGDTHMGIGFPAAVDVQGAYFAGQAAQGAWTPAIRVRGYRDGQLVQETDWFGDIGATPRWLDLDLRNVECMEIVSTPVLVGGGWYGMDDLTYTIADSAAGDTQHTIVVDFEDLPYDFKLTGSSYAGLTWETGSGTFDEAVHGPLIPPGYSRAEHQPAADEPPASGTRATTPDLVGSFQGVIRGDAGSMSYPPDTIGAIGPNHYVETVNRNFAIYNKANGAQLTNILLGSFLPGSNGDPRVLYDQHSGRWIVLVTDFSATATMFLAVSLTRRPDG